MRTIRRSQSRLGRVEVGVENIACDVYLKLLDAAYDAAFAAAFNAAKSVAMTKVAFDAAVDAAHEVACKASNPTKAQRVAVLRAMHTFVSKHPAYALAGGKGVTPLRIVRIGSVLSRSPKEAARATGGA